MSSHFTCDSLNHGGELIIELIGLCFCILINNVNSLFLESCRGELEDLMLQWLHWAQAAYEEDKILTCKSKEGYYY